MFRVQSRRPVKRTSGLDPLDYELWSVLGEKADGKTSIKFSESLEQSVVKDNG